MYGSIVVAFELKFGSEAFDGGEEFVGVGGRILVAGHGVVVGVSGGGDVVVFWDEVDRGGDIVMFVGGGGVVVCDGGGGVVLCVNEVGVGELDRVHDGRSRFAGVNVSVAWRKGRRGGGGRSSKEI